MPAAGEAVPSSVRRAFTGVCIALAGAIVGASLWAALIHIDDRFGVAGIESIRIALAKYANLGQLYPPLRDGLFYGGTRYMPLPVVFHAAAALVTGDYISAGKVVTIAASLLLVGAMFAALRGLGTGPGPAALLAVTPLATRPGWSAAIGISGDILPAAAQVVALVAIFRSRSRASIAIAAGACAVALLSKLSAVWAAGAILIWLLYRRERKQALMFGAVYITFSAAGLLAFQLGSEGRMLENLVRLGAAGIDADSLANVAWKYFALTRDFAPIAFALVGGCVVLLSLRRAQEIVLYPIALTLVLAGLLVVLADRGALGNHLIDLVVIAPLALAELAGGEGRLGRVVTALAAVAVAVSFTATGLGALRAAADPPNESSTQPSVNPTPLADELDDASFVLSDDPMVSVARGERPYVLDPWALRQLVTADRALDDPLVEAIDNQVFTTVVLGQDLRFRDWWDSYHLGSAVARALRRNYEAAGRAEGYYLYAPRARP